MPFDFTLISQRTTQRYDSISLSTSLTIFIISLVWFYNFYFLLWHHNFKTEARWQWWLDLRLHDDCQMITDMPFAFSSWLLNGKMAPHLNHWSCMPIINTQQAVKTGNSSCIFCIPNTLRRWRAERVIHYSLGSSHCCISQLSRLIHREINCGEAALHELLR